MALVTDYIKSLDATRNIQVTKIAEMNGGFTLRNKIPDGRFGFWEEYNGTGTTTSGFGSDTLWHNEHSGSTKVHSRQLLTPGVDLPAIDCPSAYYFSRTVVTSVAGASNYCRKYVAIEDVRTLAGKTVTLSFYAKADAAKNVCISLEQIFGTSGSTSVFGIGTQLVSLSTTWKRYSVNITIPSVSGKTINSADSKLIVIFWFDVGSTIASGSNIATAGLGQQSGTFDLACIQLEEGTVMTPFEELPVSVAYDILNRYFVLMSVDGGYTSGSTGYTSRDVFFRTLMRTTPTVTFGTGYTNGVWSNQGYVKVDDSGTTSNVVTINSDIAMLRIIRTAASSDGQGLRCTFIADSRL